MDQIWQLAYYVLAAIGMALSGIAVWLKPHFDEMLKLRRDGKAAEVGALQKIPGLAESCERSASATANLADKLSDTHERMAAAMDVITAIMSANSLAGNSRREVILLIEDSAVSAASVERVCLDLAEKFSFMYRHVSQLRFAYPEIARVKIAVVDMTLPDASHEEVLQFIRACGCEVIIYSGDDWSEHVGPRCRVVVKPDAKKLRDELELLLIKTQNER